MGVEVFQGLLLEGKVGKQDGRRRILQGFCQVSGEG